MNKHLMIIMLFLLGIGAAFYADDILAIFNGMGPLEALEFILNWVLHVAVVTIVAFFVFGLPEIVRPWMRMLRTKRKAVRRGEIQHRAHSQRLPRFDKNAAIAALTAELMAKQAKSQQPAQNDPGETIRLDL